FIVICHLCIPSSFVIQASSFAVEQQLKYSPVRVAPVTFAQIQLPPTCRRADKWFQAARLHRFHRRRESFPPLTSAVLFPPLTRDRAAMHPGWFAKQASRRCCSCDRQRLPRQFATPIPAPP